MNRNRFKRFFTVGITAFALNLCCAFSPAFACERSDPVDLTIEACAKLVQDALIWTGDYSGLADGKAGKNTENAIRLFQQRIKSDGGGQLYWDDYLKLTKTAKAKKAQAGFVINTLKDKGIKLGLPKKLAPIEKKGAWGPEWQNKDRSFAAGAIMIDDGRTLDEVYEKLKAKSGREVSYDRRSGNWFVISGQDGGVQDFYTRLEGEAPVLRGFSVTYAKENAATFRPIVIAIAASFEITGPPEGLADEADQDMAADRPAPAEARDASNLAARDQAAAAAAWRSEGRPAQVPSIPDPCSDPRFNKGCAPASAPQNADGGEEEGEEGDARN
jgi:peptidoglycan hydrolase-like protein with peptidoglycan-binding domain